MGLLYDKNALAAAEALVLRYEIEEFTALRPLVPKTAMETPWGRGTLRDLAREVVGIATQGLRSRSILAGGDESKYLDPLQTIAEGGPTEASIWCDKYNESWNAKITAIFDEAAI